MHGAERAGRPFVAYRDVSASLSLLELNGERICIGPLLGWLPSQGSNLGPTA